MAWICHRILGSDYCSNAHEHYLQYQRYHESLDVEPAANDSVFGVFTHEIVKVSQEILIALAPVVVIFLVFQRASIRMSKLALKENPVWRVVYALSDWSFF